MIELTALLCASAFASMPTAGADAQRPVAVTDNINAISADPAARNLPTAQSALQTKTDDTMQQLVGSGPPQANEGTMTPQADNKPTGAVSAAADEGQGHDIIVTATRRSARLQDVPQSLVAIQNNTLKSLKIENVVDIPQLVSGLEVNRLGASANLYMRGVGTSSSGYNTEPPVATYIDGVYLPNSASGAFSFNNIERIEVLKGPQGTLYGRNSTGGLVNVITRDPDPKPTLDASIGYANYHTFSLNLYASAPVSDNLGFNLAVTHTNQSDGWGKNIFTGSEILRYREDGYQGKLVWSPGPSTRITLRGMYDRVHSDEGTFAAIYPGTLGVDGTPYLGRYVTSTRRDSDNISKQFNVSLKVEADLGFAKFQSISAYLYSTNPLDHITLGGIAGKPDFLHATVELDLRGQSKTLTQEFQLSSKTTKDDRLQWITGFYYLHDNTREGADISLTCAGTVCTAFPPFRTTGFPTTRSYSGYAEGTYRVLAETRVTLGLRYTRDEKGLTGSVVPLAGFPNSMGLLFPGTVLFPGAPYPGNPAGIQTAIAASKLTYKAVVAQEITPRVNVYASYNRGFKSGGYNPISFVNVPSRPEVLDAFEVGLKSQLLNRILTFNLAGFYYKYRDVQLNTTAPPAPPGTAIVYNAGKERIQGVDADFNLAPTSALSINGSFEYLDAVYTSFIGGTCLTPVIPSGPFLGGNSSAPCDLTGKRPPNAPTVSFTLGVLYKLPVKFGSFTLAANDSFKSRSYWNPDNRLSQNPFHLINSSLTWTSLNGAIDVQVYVKNLTNYYYFTSGVESTNDIYVPAAPRTFGATLRYRY